MSAHVKNLEDSPMYLGLGSGELHVGQCRERKPHVKLSHKVSVVQRSVQK